MGMFSRSKGKRGERMFASLCREQGYDVHRTSQYCVKHGTADVVGLPGVYVEVKYVQALNIAKAMEQSERDADAAGKDEFPIVASKRAGDPWLVTMYACHFVTLVILLRDEFLDCLHVIHKPAKRFSVRKFLREAVREYENEKGALVAVKYPRGDNASLVTMYAEDWFTLYREWEAGMDLKRRAEREEH